MLPRPSLSAASGVQLTVDRPLYGEYLGAELEVSGRLETSLPGPPEFFLLVDGAPSLTPAECWDLPAADSDAADPGPPAKRYRFLIEAPTQGWPHGYRYLELLVRQAGSVVASAATLVAFENPRLKGVIEEPSSWIEVNGLLQVEGVVARFSRFAMRVSIWVDGRPADAHFRWYRRTQPSWGPEIDSLNEASGFTASMDTSSWAEGEHQVSLVAEIEGQSIPWVLDSRVVVQSPACGVFEHLILEPNLPEPDKRLSAILDLARSPCCRDALRVDGDHVVCGTCGQRYRLKGRAPVLIAGEPRYPIEADQSEYLSSSHPYPVPVWKRLVEVCDSGGWALEIGSGRRGYGVERLVQLEICHYPFVDVISQDALLPFGDASFDLVFACAVTEHVERPWVLAAEMQRVLKPGGTIYVDSAFLQPLHDYPAHYFNMTGEALSSLFPHLEVELLGIAPWHVPWYSATWILHNLLSAVSAESRAEIEKLSVRQFLNHLRRFFKGRHGRFDTVPLPPEVTARCAAGFTLIGRKPVSPP